MHVYILTNPKVLKRQKKQRATKCSIAMLPKILHIDTKNYRHSSIWVPIYIIISNVKSKQNPEKTANPILARNIYTHTLFFFKLSFHYMPSTWSQRLPPTFCQIELPGLSLSVFSSFLFTLPMERKVKWLGPGGKTRWTMGSGWRKKAKEKEEGEEEEQREQKTLRLQNALKDPSVAKTTGTLSTRIASQEGTTSERRLRFPSSGPSSFITDCLVGLWETQPVRARG